MKVSRLNKDIPLCFNPDVIMELTKQRDSQVYGFILMVWLAYFVYCTLGKTTPRRRY
jgi:hypothetical protein